MTKTQQTPQVLTITLKVLKNELSEQCVDVLLAVVHLTYSMADQSFINFKCNPSIYQQSEAPPLRLHPFVHSKSASSLAMKVKEARDNIHGKKKCFKKTSKKRKLIDQKCKISLTWKV